MFKQDWINDVPEEGIDCKGVFYKKIDLGRAKDITGQKFNKLTALFRVEKNGDKRRTWFLFYCDCGNLFITTSSKVWSNHTHSCGCHKKESSRTDLTGKRFGKLVVVSYAFSKDRKVYWNCQCDCGGNHIASGKNLQSGIVRSCGCLQRKDITGQKFGLLTAVKYSYTKNGEAMWECKCDCGKTTVASGHNLRRGDTKSCGCLISLGENKIEKLLEENNITFMKQYWIENCRDKNPLPFDFAIFDREGKLLRLTEYDGRQHYVYCEFFGGKGKFEERRLHDQIKNDYCKEHNIPLVRIPYTVKDITLDMLLGDEYLIS